MPKKPNLLAATSTHQSISFNIKEYKREQTICDKHNLCHYLIEQGLCAKHGQFNKNFTNVYFAIWPCSAGRASVHAQAKHFSTFMTPIES
jgi:hypothetical protein